MHSYVIKHVNGLLKINQGLEVGNRGYYNKLGEWIQRMKLKPQKVLNQDWKMKNEKWREIINIKKTKFAFRQIGFHGKD